MTFIQVESRYGPKISFISLISEGTKQIFTTSSKGESRELTGVQMRNMAMNVQIEAKLASLTVQREANCTPVDRTEFTCLKTRIRLHCNQLSRILEL